MKWGGRDWHHVNLGLSVLPPNCDLRFYIKIIKADKCINGRKQQHRSLWQRLLITFHFVSWHSKTAVQFSLI